MYKILLLVAVTAGLAGLLISAGCEEEQKLATTAAEPVTMSGMPVGAKMVDIKGSIKSRPKPRKSLFGPAKPTSQPSAKMPKMPRINRAEMKPSP